MPRPQLPQDFTTNKNIILSNETYGLTLYAMPEQIDDIRQNTVIDDIFQPARTGNAAAIMAHTNQDKSGAIANSERIVFDLPPARHVALSFQYQQDDDTKTVLVTDNLLRDFAEDGRLVMDAKPVNKDQLDLFLHDNFHGDAHGQPDRKDHTTNYVLFNGTPDAKPPGRLLMPWA